MSSRPQTPSATYSNVPAPDDAHLNRGYGSGAPSRTDLHDFAHEGNRADSAQTDNHAAHSSNATAVEHDASGLDRSASSASTAAGGPSRSGTLKKRQSVSRKTSLKRSGSRKSLRAGSTKGVAHGDRTDDHEYNSAFYTPIPTSSSPTEILANRFQGESPSMHQNRHA